MRSWSAPLSSHAAHERRNEARSMKGVGFRCIFMDTMDLNSSGRPAVRHTRIIVVQLLHTVQLAGLHLVHRYDLPLFNGFGILVIVEPPELLEGIFLISS